MWSPCAASDQQLPKEQSENSKASLAGLYCKGLYSFIEQNTLQRVGEYTGFDQQCPDYLYFDFSVTNKTLKIYCISPFWTYNCQISLKKFEVKIFYRSNWSNCD